MGALISRHMKILPSAVVLLIAMTGCGELSRDSRGSSVASSNVSPLSVFEAPTPPLQVPNYRTSGTYPQVSSSKVNLRAVNAALRNSVLRAQHQYARWVRREYGRTMPELFRPNYRYSGEYGTSPRLSLISASTVVVSALIPVRQLLPGGTGGATWLSVTVRVPSGAPVGIRDLFAEPARGLNALAKEVKREVLSTNSCVRQSVNNERAFGFAQDVRGFDPTPSNYRYFALIASGLAVGFRQDQVGGSSCSSVQAAVPYAVLHPYLSELGQKLIAGVRRPQRMKR